MALKIYLSPKNVKSLALIHSATNFIHGIIFPLVQRNTTKRDGIKGNKEPSGEIFLQSMSEGTVANWNDVQNWEEGNDLQTVWHEWDTTLLNHNYNAWAAVSKACVCGHTPAPTQFTGCWVGIDLRPEEMGLSKI